MRILFLTSVSAGSVVPRPEQYWRIMAGKNPMFPLPTPGRPEIRCFPCRRTFVFREFLKPCCQRRRRGLLQLEIPYRL